MKYQKIDAALAQAVCPDAIAFGDLALIAARAAEQALTDAQSPAEPDAAIGSVYAGLDAGEHAAPLERTSVYRANVVYPPARVPTTDELDMLEGRAALPVDPEPRALLIHSRKLWGTGGGLVHHGRGVCRATLEDVTGVPAVRFGERGGPGEVLAWLVEVMPRAMAPRVNESPLGRTSRLHAIMGGYDQICLARGYGAPLDQFGRLASRAAAEDAGLPLYAVIHNRGIRDRLRGTVSTYGPGPVVPFEHLGRDAAVRARFAAMKAKVEELVAAGTPLPGDPGLRRIPSAAGIARLVDGEGEQLDDLSWMPAFQRVMRTGAAVVGVRTPGEVGPTLWTYGALLDFGEERLRIRLAGQKTAEQGVRNRLSALKVMMEELSRATSDDPLKNLGTGLDAYLGTSMRSRSWKSQIRGWADLLREMVGERGQWASAGEALREIRLTRRLTYKQIGDVIGVGDGHVQRWATGQHAPTARHAEGFGRLERSLGYADGSLVGLIRAPARFRKAAAAVVGTMPQAVSRFMTPEDANLAPEAIEAKGRRIAATRVRQPSRAGAVAVVARARWNAIEQPGPDAPFWEENGLIRAFKCATVSLSRERGGHRARWRQGTASLRLQKMVRGMALIRRPVTEGGLGMDDAELSVVLALNPIIFVEMALGRSIMLAGARSRNGVRGAILTEADRQLILLSAGLLRAGTGFVRQNPWLVERLRANSTPLIHVTTDSRMDAHLLSPEQLEVMPQAIVDLAKRDWAEACAQGERQARQIAADLRVLVQPGRDPFEPFQVMIDQPMPLAPFYRLMYESERRMPDLHASPRAHHQAMRAGVLVRLASATFLRSRNIRKMTYLEDNSGNLRFVDGHWEIHIPWQEFKNGVSQDLFGPWASRMNYKRRLPDVAGLYALLRRYVEVSLPALRARFPESPYMFPTANSPFMTTQTISRAFTDWTRLHCVYDEARGTGMPGVMIFSIHAIRDLGATTVLKDYDNANRVQEAADLLQTSPEMVRTRYAKLAVVDRLGRADPALQAASDLALGGTPLWADAA